MRKLSVFFIGIILSFAFVFCGNITLRAAAEPITVYVGGFSAGFTLKTGGAQVIGLSEVATDKGVYSPAATAGIQSGDIIYKVEGIRVETIADLNEVVDKSKGKTLSMDIYRGNESIQLKTNAVKESQTNKYKIGVLVRESISGIGTVTYIDKTTKRFASLGHSVVGENNRELQIYNGMVYECSIVGVSKGVRGKAGELRGMFLSDKKLGSAEKLCNCGIFGQISEDFKVNDLVSAVASSYEVKPGKAYIYSTVNGTLPMKYQIEIVKVDKWNRENKNYVIKVTDDALIAETGGIVQGMSGSPILQDGKLVGAVTHVFLNDPTRGYGISIEEMLNE